MKEAFLYKKLKDRFVQCLNCAHKCVIPAGKKGTCGVRENNDGNLFALNYGKIIARNVDPIEKKPLFHFLPGSRAYSVSSLGCNLKCANCQNYDISQSPKFESQVKFWGEELSPEEIVRDAIREDCASIAYTYTEPTVFLEFALETMKIAREKKLKNVWVSNGFMTEQSAELIIPHLDANNIDIKGFSEDFYRENCGAKLKPVLDIVKLMKKSGIWIEITTLSIPTLSDSEEMFKGIAKFIKDELGPETPWHISQFSGEISWKLKHLPETSVETLERGYRIGKEVGLKYVYTGNVPGLPSENTICPNCNTLSIRRLGYFIERFDNEGKCSKCGTDLNIILS